MKMFSGTGPVCCDHVLNANFNIKGTRTHARTHAHTHTHTHTHTLTLVLLSEDGIKTIS
jgi:hypothetical protein